MPTGQDRVTAELFAEDLVVGEDGREAFADHLLAREVVASRTLFSRVPTDLYRARAAMAAAVSGIFSDDFESGDTTRWSVSSP